MLKALRALDQARFWIGEAVGCAASIERARMIDFARPFGPGDRAGVVECHRAAQAIYAQCFSTRVRERLFAARPGGGIDFRRFETALAILREALLDTEGARDE